MPAFHCIHVRVNKLVNIFFSLQQIKVIYSIFNTPLGLNSKI